VRILLIGGSGFIGRRVVACLQQRGHHVIIFHRGQTGLLAEVDAERITGNRLEIDRHIESIVRARPDATIDFLPWNDTDTRRVVDALNGRTGRVVHLSSGDVYRAWGNFLHGTYGEPVPLDEQAPLRSDLYPYAGTRPGMEHYDKVLAETRDPREMEIRFEEDFADRKEYIEAYRHHHAYHGAHPFYVWYWCGLALRHLGRVIVVGAKKREVVERLGFEPASSLEEAWRMAGETLGGDYSITHLSIPPIFATRGQVSNIELDYSIFET